MWNAVASSLSKIVRQEQDHLPKKLLGAWFQCPRKLGQLQKSCRNLAISALRTILPEISVNGKFSNFFLVYKRQKHLDKHPEATRRSIPALL
jgi:hypothetical protein